METLELLVENLKINFFSFLIEIFDWWLEPVYVLNWVLILIEIGMLSFNLNVDFSQLLNIFQI